MAPKNFCKLILAKIPEEFCVNKCHKNKTTKSSYKDYLNAHK